MAERTKPTLDSPVHHFTAGDTIQTPSTRSYFLSPTPLPTGLEPGDRDGLWQGDETEATIELGGPKSTAYQWAVLINVIWVCILVGFGVPFIVFLMVGGFWEVVGMAWLPAFLLFLIGGSVILPDKTKMGLRRAMRKVTPVVFNRQKREVWVTFDDGTSQCIDWETIGFMISEAKGATQYGVVSQTSMMFIFPKPNDQNYTLECLATHPLTAAGTWETLRAWMEYEIDDIRSLNPTYQAGDPPWEGLHTFRTRRKQLYTRYQEGTLPLWQWLGWHIWRIVIFGWDLNYRGADWTGRRLAEVKAEGYGRWSPELLDWCKPIPKEQWKKASSYHRETSRRMREALSSKSHGYLEFVATMHKVRAGILKEVAAVYGDELEGFDAIHHDWNGPLDVRKVEQRGGI